MKKRDIFNFTIFAAFCLVVFVFLSISASNAQNPPLENIDGPTVLAEHRKVSSKFIEVLYVAAKNNPGIGQELKSMAREQNQSETIAVTALEQIMNRNRFLKYILGSDYASGNQTRDEAAKTGSRIRKLENLMDRAQNADTKALVKVEVIEIRKDQARVENFVQGDQNHFSLLGWLIRLVY